LGQRGLGALDAAEEREERTAGPSGRCRTGGLDARRERRLERSGWVGAVTAGMNAPCGTRGALLTSVPGTAPKRRVHAAPQRPAEPTGAALDKARLGHPASYGLLIVIGIAAEIVVCPEVSRAVAVSMYGPFSMLRESHTSVNFVDGDSVVTSGAMSCPSN
jgi:hypothetical protein